MPEQTMNNSNIYDVPEEYQEIIIIKKPSMFKEVVQRFKRNRKAVYCFYIIVVLILLAIFASVLFPEGYDVQDVFNRFQFPSSEHWFGTDQYGRDIFTRVVYGTRYSLSVGLVSVTFSCFLGVLLGCIAGFYGDVADNVVMRIVDIMLAIPNILLGLSICSMLGTGLINLIIAVGLGAMPGYARIVRASILSIKNTEYVEASHSIGASNARIIVKHILPNCMAPIIVQATMSISIAILTAATLSFLGLGIDPPTPEWGCMLSQNRAYLRDFWPGVTFPGLAIVITVFAFNILGDGLRDALDPKLKN